MATVPAMGLVLLNLLSWLRDIRVKDEVPATGLILSNLLSWQRDIRVTRMKCQQQDLYFWIYYPGKGILDEVPATRLIFLNLSWQRDIRETRMKSWQWDLYFLIYYPRNKVLSNVEWCLKRLIQWQLTFSLHYNNDINLHDAFSSHKIHNHLTEW